MTERWITIPNWDRFQHYGLERRPLWVKNYTTLLSKDEYLDLSFASRGMLHGIWLAYASRDGLLRLSDLSSILHDRARIRNVEALNHAGFIDFLASRPLYLSTTKDRRARESATIEPPPLQLEQREMAAERWIASGAAVAYLELSDERISQVIEEDFKITDADVVANLVRRLRQSTRPT